MSGNIRKTDFAARIGGDEFAILLTEANASDAKKVIFKIRDLLIQEMKTSSYPVTFSIGLATFETPPNSFNDMVRTSDLLMKEVKNSTKNDIKHELFSEGQNINFI